MIAGDLDLVFGLVRLSQIQLEVGCVSIFTFSIRFETDLSQGFGQSRELNMRIEWSLRTGGDT